MAVTLNSVSPEFCLILEEKWEALKTVINIKHAEILCGMCKNAPSITLLCGIKKEKTLMSNTDLKFR